MYDYFQGQINHPVKPVNVHYLPSFPFDTYHLKGLDNNKAAFEYYGNRKGILNYMPSEVTKVGKIDYYDKLGHIVVSEQWDSRGFASRQDAYHIDGSLGASRYLRPDGSTAILVTYMNKNGQVGPTMWKLMSYKGRDWVFNSEEALFSFFLNEINQKERGNFITERRGMDQFALAVNNPLSRIAVVHSVPVKNPKNIEKSPLLAGEETLFDPHRRMPVHFNHIVFATDEQRQDFEKRFGRNLPQTSFDVAADSYVQLHQGHGDSAYPTIVYRGMLGRTKKTGDLIRAFHHVAKQDKAVHFKLQGYFENSQQEKEIKELLKKTGLQDKVKIVPYEPYDSQFFQDASLFVNPTGSEAFGMNALEAMASGVPVVTFDVPYIANNLVRNQINGVLVKKHNPRDLASAAVILLNDKEKMEKLSAGANDTARQYTESRLVADWQKILR
ncbi:glycosyltransferase [Limosilactobacillus sp.]|uniref:glycosyltransferase n=1 Tax=Limosilactobacillus sp. TaxID=2773925 RepID=UPI00345EAB35